MPVVGASRAIFDPAMESTVTLGNLVPGMRDLWLAMCLCPEKVREMCDVCVRLTSFPIFKCQKRVFSATFQPLGA